MADEDKKTSEGQTEEAAADAVTTSAAEEAAINEAPAEVVKVEEAAVKIVPGMVVRVHVRIKETTPRGDERERIQMFAGTVIAKKGRTSRGSATITVRKVSGGVGVERIFPLNMPTIEKIEVVKRYRTGKSKLYFLRNYKKRLKEVKK